MYACMYVCMHVCVCKVKYRIVWYSIEYRVYRV